jgi:hypothetical protein
MLFSGHFNAVDLAVHGRGVPWASLFFCMVSQTHRALGEALL